LLLVFSSTPFFIFLKLKRALDDCVYVVSRWDEWGFFFHFVVRFFPLDIVDVAEFVVRITPSVLGVLCYGLFVLVRGGVCYVVSDFFGVQ